MKKVLVNKGDNSVIHVSNIAIEVENGIDVGGIVFGAVDVIDVFDVEDSAIPINAVGKYCYSPSEGFTNNPNWSPPVDETVAELQAQNAQIILALVMNDLM